jgi:UDP-N-acetylglucosamine 2-epimerase
VLNAEPDARSILDRIQTARSAEFRQSLQGMTNLYGEGCASQRIISVLTSLSFDEELLIKRARAIG